MRVHGRGRPKLKLFEVGIAVKRLISIHSLAWIVAVAGTFAVTPAWAELKIGVVDYGKLMEESPQAKTVVEAIRTEFTPRQKDLQNQQQTLKAKEDKLQKDGATMTEDQRARSTRMKARRPRCFCIQALKFSRFLSPRKTVRSSRGPT